MTHPIRSIVIVGGGTAGWMAAAALSRFAPFAITLVESEAIGTVGVGEATIPQIRLFNAALGIDEGEFLRETRGSYKLGIEFAGWAGEGTRYMHAFGPTGHAHGILPFHQYWTQAHLAGQAEAFGAYSLNAVAASALRMQADRPDAPGPMPYAFHFDAGLYAAYLRRRAEAGGVTRLEGIVAQVNRADAGERITSITLADGRTVAGDFFIDCSGFRSLLMEAIAPGEFVDWSGWLPCDRAWAVPCATSGDFTPYTRSTARPAGWQWRIPLQHRIGNGHVFCSRFMDEVDARTILLAHLDGKPEAEPRLLRFTTGTRARHWVGNCLALGLAAGFMEPLESTSIHLVQSAIARFLQMLPGQTAEPALAAEFNRQAEFEWSRIRDFLILHYWANGREGEPFWDVCRRMELPDTLVSKLATWRSTGFLQREHEELFTLEGWSQVLIGQGVIPGAANPATQALAADQLAAMLAGISERNRRTAAAMPLHVAALREAVTPPELRKTA